MREILFRGKRVDNGEWVEGFYYHGDYKHGSYIIPLRIDECLDVELEVIPESVGQFTGLTDKNGNKIFEGDILTFIDFRGVHISKKSSSDGFINGWIGLVKWSDNKGWILDKNNNHNESMLLPLGSEKGKRSNPYVYSNSSILRVNPEIISNIHDNQELLK